MKRVYKSGAILFLVLGFIAYSGCYPLSTGSVNWRIKWNKKKLKQQRLFVEENTIVPDDSRPNIVLILADDLGKYEVSAYGAEHIHTPYIDELAREGVLFKDAYVTAPICAPSRAGLLTGRYQQRFGFETQPIEFYPTNLIEYLSGKYFLGADEWKISTNPRYPREWQIAKQGIPPTELTLAEALKMRGYVTGITGKWHLGIHNKWHIPNKRGFDFQYGFAGAFSLYTPEKSSAGYVNHIQDSFSAKYQWESGRKENGAITLNNKVISEEDYLTFAIRDRAIQFIKDHRNEPFFLYVPFSAPHIPFQAPVDYYCLYSDVEDENKRVYYAMISALDDAIGDIHNTIKSLGLEENTIIYFLSDNGGAAYTMATDNGPLKGGKLTPFEGGVNIPFIMKWKGKIAPGTIYEKPVLSLDVFATSTAAAGCKLPDDRVYDGVNIIEYLDDTKKEEPHDIIYWRADHVSAMRSGNYKIITSTRDDWVHLYDLEKDMAEDKDLQNDKPGLRRELLEQHRSWQLELPKKPLWPRIMDRKFVIGGVEYLFPA